MAHVSAAFVGSREYCLLGRAAPAFLLLLGAGLAAMPAAAQEIAQPSPVPEPACRVFAVKRAEGPVQDLHAGCRGVGVMLGPVTAYEVIGNDALQATLIDARLGTERRVLLLSLQADGQPLVENLTGQLALAAGRGPASEIEGVELDLARFADDGQIGLSGQVEDTGLTKSERINLAGQVALERASAPVGAQQ